MIPTPQPLPQGRHILITGGAGFVGTNLADKLAALGNHVIVFDNLSRAGVEENLAWLQAQHPKNVHFELADVRDSAKVKSVVQSVDHVFHLAAQVAVTTSLLEPRFDHDVNVGGTLNVLEAIRCAPAPPTLIFTSTNKVYGALSELGLRPSKTRYEPESVELRLGVNEQASLNFHSPYGCSKGAADQYVLDYSRSFNISTVVFRMSCIFGPHQMGTEDQGWIAHFVRHAIEGKQITICGDGLQVRDALFVEDLVDAFLLAQNDIAKLSGEAFNIGGGCGNTVSLLEVLSCIEDLNCNRPKTEFEAWRQGDQRYYVSDIRKFKAATGWSPKTPVLQGIRCLYDWMSSRSWDRSSFAMGGSHALLVG